MIIPVCCCWGANGCLERGGETRAVFAVRVCAPGKIHSALVTARCPSLSPASPGQLVLPRPSCGRWLFAFRCWVRVLKGGTIWGIWGMLGCRSAFVVTIAKNPLSCTVWGSSRESVLSTFHSKLPGLTRSSVALKSAGARPAWTLRAPLPPGPRSHHLFSANPCIH